MSVIQGRLHLDAACILPSWSISREECCVIRKSRAVKAVMDTATQDGHLLEDMAQKNFGSNGKNIVPFFSSNISQHITTYSMAPVASATKTKDML